MDQDIQYTTIYNTILYTIQYCIQYTTNRTPPPIRSLIDRILELESTMDRNTVRENCDENLDPLDLDLDIFHVDL